MIMIMTMIKEDVFFVSMQSAAGVDRQRNGDLVRFNFYFIYSPERMRLGQPCACVLYKRVFLCVLLPPWVSGNAQTEHKTTGRPIPPIVRNDSILHQLYFLCTFFFFISPRHTYTYSTTQQRNQWTKGSHILCICLTRRLFLIRCGVKV